MITIYKEESKTNLIKKEYESLKDIKVEEGSWIHISSPSEEILKEVSEVTKINLPFLMCSLDEEESARVDVDDGDTLIVLDTPFIEDIDNEKYSTAPFIIAYNEKYYVTIEKHDFKIVDELFKRVKVIEPHKHIRFTLNIVYRVATLFITYLKKINVYTTSIEKNLRNSTKNKEVLELMDVNKCLIYFATALNANKGVLSRLIKSERYNKFEDDFDLMEDTQVEINQAIETCSILRDVSTGMMDAFASIINNNVNTIMKTLAVITIVLSIPTVIASFWGMNFTFIPFDDTKYGFYILVGISLLLATIGAILLYLFSNKRNKK